MTVDRQNLAKKTVKKGFTLPEVIVSFSVITLVIVTASNVLSVVMRTNADNVGSMVAYGLAQEGLESVRFMRDSNAVLGLDFDGSVKSNTNLIWGEKLLDMVSGRPQTFILIDKTPSVPSCTQANLIDCMPVALKEVSGSIDSLAKDISTTVYLVQTGSSSDPALTNFQYLQTDASAPGDSEPSQFHRVIMVQPLKDPVTAPTFNAMRVSSMVFWTAAGGIDKKVVLTTELTDWK